MDSISDSRSEASQRIDVKFSRMGDWRGEMIGRIRALIKQADLDVIEELK